jgi:hypothetical protein
VTVFWSPFDHSFRVEKLLCLLEFTDAELHIGLFLDSLRPLGSTFLSHLSSSICTRSLPSGRTMLAKIKDRLNAMLQCEIPGGWFAHIDPVVLGFTDYNKYIRKRMDLNTVKVRKLFESTRRTQTRVRKMDVLACRK